MDRNEKIIRSTDYDALSCRISACKKHYLDDKYLQNVIHGLEKFLRFENKISSRRVFNGIVNSVKLPIINRGTYIRTKSIDYVIEEFLREFDGQQVQIVNLGAGSDTRAFQILASRENINWVEFDFKDSTKLKKAIITTDQVLANAVGVDFVPVDDFETFYTELDDTLISEKYKLISIDLRDIETLKTIISTELDLNAPTLIISECMLCYTESSVSTNIIQSIRSHFTKGVFAIYDPIGGEDNFGSVMIDNLKIRNISMPSLLEFNTLEKYSQRLQELGIKDVKIDNMNNIMNNWISDDEKIRISRLEFLDESEELRLLLEHYCLIVCNWGFEWSDLKLQFQ
ncbi:unnamed protein product [Wickerhamomyces anomalus]